MIGLRKSFRADVSEEAGTRPRLTGLAALTLGLPLAWGATEALLALGELPLCAFRELAGLPCPLCGGTHALNHLLELDIAAATHANPGVVGAALIWILYPLASALPGRHMGGTRGLSALSAIALGAGWIGTLMR